jgi:hypothetical protein
MATHKSLPDWLHSILAASFGSTSSALALASIFLNQDRYDRVAALKLLESAKGMSGERWAERLFAAMLLEKLLLNLSLSNLSEFDFLFVQLGLKPQTGPDILLASSVLDDGYSTRKLSEFATEFHRRLSRLSRLQPTPSPGDWDDTAWRNLLRSTREVSKLTLARYVFSPIEVAEEIRRNVIVSSGVRHTFSRVHGKPEYDRPGDLPAAPSFELEILDSLCQGQHIFWVAESTSSELNSLVEYPLTSAVLVVKPPGSDREFEIKRAGMRGRRKLDILWERDGKLVPVSHRLYGGSFGWLGRREGVAVALFSRIYRLVHGKNCPCSHIAATSSVVGIPGNRGEQHILKYFTDPAVFGDGFDNMREALDKCVTSSPLDTGIAPASFPGEAGLTLQFIGQAQPQQAVLFDSTSFRLDRIAEYLSEAGPEKYFRDGLGRDYRREDARWLAETVLEEMLGMVARPSENYSNHTQYVQNTLEVPENRRRADAAYLSLVGQIGECWGTLLATRGYSDGESFVLRNVGLKSMWKDGDWQVRILFMDNDDLMISGRRYQHFWPLRGVPGMLRDQIHILGGPLAGAVLPGEIGILKRIYAVSAETAESGWKTFEEAMKISYAKTHSEFASNKELQSLFFPSFLERLGDFDELVKNFLRTDPEQHDVWKSQASYYLRGKNYTETFVAEYVQAIPQFRRFFERIQFLYSPK